MENEQQTADYDRITAMRADGVPWRDIYEQFPQYPDHAIRAAYYRRREKALPPPRVTGETVADNGIDEDAVWRAAIASYERVRKRAGAPRRIEFDYGPVCFVLFADIHAGAPGTDYARLEREMQIVNDTPGMYAGFVGDWADNYIIGKLARYQYENPFTLTEQWALVKKSARLIAPKLLFMVSGNHDAWSRMLTGIDYFREVQEAINPGALYARDDLRMVVSVGGHEYRWRVRHKWRGSSQYSDTFGIEKAAKFDKGIAFEVGVAAHTHRSGLIRPFNNGGKTGLAILCGAYKRIDGYAIQEGFPAPNEQTAVAFALTERGTFVTFTSVEDAAEYMRAMV